jgi:hypothetical protein
LDSVWPEAPKSERVGDLDVTTSHNMQYASYFRMPYIWIFALGNTSHVYIVRTVYARMLIFKLTLTVTKMSNNQKELNWLTVTVTISK